jgi:hypothetical protein
MDFSNDLRVFKFSLGTLVSAVRYVAYAHKSSANK